MSVLTWWRAWRKRRDCFHHDWRTGRSWIATQLVNTGAGKMFWCRQCSRTWFA